MIVVVGTFEDCSGLKVGLFNTSPPANAQISDGFISKVAVILAQGQGAHGVLLSIGFQI